jgi:proteasome lid subunit RPN8/RPN11
MSLVVDQPLQSRIYAQMEAAYPNEGGGFLLGSKNGDLVRVEDVIQVQNVFSEEEQYHRYAMRAWEDFGRYEDEADSRGLRLLGYYHSHPDWPAVPSDFDRDHAFPNFIFLITSVEKGKAVVMRAWQLRADYSQFDEVAVSS